MDKLAEIIRDLFIGVITGLVLVGIWHALKFAVLAAIALLS